MKWFRLYHEILDDPKLRGVSAVVFRDMIHLMCLACEREKNGNIDLSLEEMAWRLRTRKKHLEQSVKKLVDLKILSNNENSLRFINWEKRQFASDNVTQRVQHWRKKKKQNETLRETLYETLGETDQNRTEQNRTDIHCPHQEIIGLYHSILPELSRVKIWSEARKKKLRARWKSDSRYQDFDWWRRFFESVRASPFLMGSNDKGWKADLDWLITERNFIKVIEGKYMN